MSVKQAARGIFLNGPSKSIIDLSKQQGLTPTHILRIPLDWKGGFGGLVTYSRKERCGTSFFTIYSYLSEFAGLDRAALTAWKLTDKRATRSAAAIAVTKMSNSRLVR